MATITLNNQTNQTITGTNDPDQITLTGTGSNNVVNGLDGADSIRAGATSSDPASYSGTTIYGGFGNDFIAGFGSGSLINGNGDADTIVFDKPADGAQAYGGQGDDTLIVSNGTASNLYLSGDLGNDFLRDTGGNTSITMIGGDGTDTINSYGINDVVNGNTGDDILVAGGSGGQISGGQDRDTLSATAAGNFLNGNKGNDYISDGGYATTIAGGQDNDVLVGTNTGSVLSGNLGADLFNATNAVFDGKSAVTVADFVSGTDKVQLSTDDPAASNGYAEFKISGGATEALAKAKMAGADYTFVAGDTNGYLIHNEGGVYTGVKISGANSLDSFAVSDIKH